MSLIDRIRAQRHVDAMVALDTFDLITARIRKLLSYGLRMSMTRRFTYVNDPPELFTGLTVDTEAWGGGYSEGASCGGRHFSVYLKPGLTTGFGFSAYPHDGNATEDEAWKRYHAAAADSESWSERRRDMTRVTLTGGMDGDFGPARDQQLVIRHWNGDGVCDERVIGFDLGKGADR